MSIYIEPKTDWTGSKDEFFNVSPDYQRIKGNIEYLHSLAVQLFPSFNLYMMEDVTFKSIPYVDFFNNIVYNIDLLANRTKRPIGYQLMRTYSENQSIWSHRDLNIIESNIKLLYGMLKPRYDLLNSLPIRLGIREDF